MPLFPGAHVIGIECDCALLDERRLIEGHALRQALAEQQ